MWPRNMQREYSAAPKDRAGPSAMSTFRNFDKFKIMTSTGRLPGHETGSVTTNLVYVEKMRTVIATLQCTQAADIDTTNEVESILECLYSINSSRHDYDAMLGHHKKLIP